jgi:hypothetical protein
MAAEPAAPNKEFAAMPDIAIFTAPAGTYEVVWVNDSTVALRGERTIYITILDIIVREDPPAGVNLGKVGLCGGQFIGIRGIWLDSWRIAGGSAECNQVIELDFGAPGRHGALKIMTRREVEKYSEIQLPEPRAEDYYGEEPFYPNEDFDAGDYEEYEEAEAEEYAAGLDPDFEL